MKRCQKRHDLRRLTWESRNNPTVTIKEIMLYLKTGLDAAGFFESLKNKPRRIIFEEK